MHQHTAGGGSQRGQTSLTEAADHGREAGIHATLQALGVNLVTEGLHALREERGVRLQRPVGISAVKVAIVRPARVHVKIHVAGVAEAGRDQHVRDLEQRRGADRGLVRGQVAEGIPAGSVPVRACRSEHAAGPRR